MNNDEYCAKHEQWFGYKGCPSCQAERERERERQHAAYTAYIERGGAADFEQWLVSFKTAMRCRRAG